MDYSVEGHARVTVGVLSNLRIIDQGVKGAGIFAWCTLDIVVGPMTYGFVYPPNKQVRRKELWNWMATTLHKGN